MEGNFAILAWIIGGGGTLIFVLLLFMWNYVRECIKGLYEYIGKKAGEVKTDLTKAYDDLKIEVDHMAEQAREDSKDNENRYVRREEFSELKSDFKQIRSDMNTNFINVNTNLGNVSGQLTALASVIGNGKKNSNGNN